MRGVSFRTNDQPRIRTFRMFMRAAMLHQHHLAAGAQTASTDTTKKRRPNDGLASPASDIPPPAIPAVTQHERAAMIHWHEMAV